MISRRLFAFSLTLAVSASALSGQVVRTFVSTTGSDVNACSRTAPCRNFTAAIAAVDAGGEVVVLDTGGFGATTIDKSVALIAPRGLHAAIAPTGGDAVLVNADVGDTVILRNLYLKGQGALVGVNLDAAAVLALDGVTFEGFLLAGIDSDANDALITVTDSHFRSNEQGMNLFGPVGPVTAVIHRCTFVDHTVAVLASSRAQVTVKDSTLQAFTTKAILATVAPPSGDSHVTVRRCTMMGRGTVLPDFFAAAVEANGSATGTATVVVADSTIINAPRGARATQGGILRIFNSVITRNGNGLENTGEAGTVVQTDGASMVHGNAINTVGGISTVGLQ